MAMALRPACNKGNGGILYLKGRSNSQWLTSAVAKEPPKNQTIPRYFAEILLRSKKQDGSKERGKEAREPLPSVRRSRRSVLRWRTRTRTERRDRREGREEGVSQVTDWLTDSRPRPPKSFCSIFSLYSLQKLILGTMTNLWNWANKSGVPLNS